MVWWIILGVALTYFFWEEIKSPFVERFQKAEANKAALTAAERMARVKVLSDSPREIEDFISKNVNLLSDATMNDLVSRLEIIKSDKIIEGDNLKNQFDKMYVNEVGADISSKKFSAGKSA